VTFAHGSAKWIDQVVENVSPCKREEMISIWRNWICHQQNAKRVYQQKSEF
jgi:hypothetical protein